LFGNKIPISLQEHDTTSAQLKLLKARVGKAGWKMHQVDTTGHCQFDAIAFQVKDFV